ncbi:MAG: hypothetical protein ACRD4I_14000 [Candidatus Angelobacter sp.]
MVPADTSPEVYAIQQQIVDAMSGEQRVLLAFEMSYYTHELAKQGLRDHHPEWPEERITWEFLRSLLPPAPPPRDSE